MLNLAEITTEVEGLREELEKARDAALDLLEILKDLMDVGMNNKVEDKP